jgi:hypothetical protein
MYKLASSCIFSFACASLTIHHIFFFDLFLLLFAMHSNLDLTCSLSYRLLMVSPIFLSRTPSAMVRAQPCDCCGEFQFYFTSDGVCDQSNDGGRGSRQNASSVADASESFIAHDASREMTGEAVDEFPWNTPFRSFGLS